MDPGDRVGLRVPVPDNFLTGMMCAISANTSSAYVVEPSRAIAAHFLGHARSWGRCPRFHAMSLTTKALRQYGTATKWG